MIAMLVVSLFGLRLSRFSAVVIGIVFVVLT